MKEYTIREINLHNHEKSCWIYAYENVYDVTAFIDNHPGSKQAILKYAGQNCDIHYDFHSKTGKKEWGRYLIGKVKYYKKQECCVIL